MTVKELIGKLKQFPGNAPIVVCDHDQDPGSGECNGTPKSVSEAPLVLMERGYGVVIEL